MFCTVSTMLVHIKPSVHVVTNNTDADWLFKNQFMLTCCWRVWTEGRVSTSRNVQFITMKSNSIKMARGRNAMLIWDNELLKKFSSTWKAACRDISLHGGILSAACMVSSIHCSCYKYESISHHTEIQIFAILTNSHSMPRNIQTCIHA